MTIMQSKILLVVSTFMLLGMNGMIMQTAASDSGLEIVPAEDILTALSEAPLRDGAPPDTPDGIPHQQHNQNAPVEMQDALREAASSLLEGIKFEQTQFSLTGSVGWRLNEEFAQGPQTGAFIRDTLEFAHQHVPADGSLHMLLPTHAAETSLQKGWGVIHPLTDDISGDNSQYVMIFGPRDSNELETIWLISQISYYQARGTSMEEPKESTLTPISPEPETSTNTPNAASSTTTWGVTATSRNFGYHSVQVACIFFLLYCI